MRVWPKTHTVWLHRTSLSRCVLGPSSIQEPTTRQARPHKFRPQAGKPNKIKALPPTPPIPDMGVTLVVSILPPCVLTFTNCDSATAKRGGDAHGGSFGLGGDVFFGWRRELVYQTYCQFEFAHGNPDLFGAFACGGCRKQVLCSLKDCFQTLHAFGSSSILFKVACHLSFLYPSR